jgi:hypothetical protein
VPVLAKENVVSEIDVKEAVRLAKEFATGIYDKEKISRLGLEAVERTEDGKHWLVTLGFSRPWSLKPQKQDALKTFREQLQGVARDPKLEREYKVFRVDAQSGAVIGMEMFSE